MDSGRVLIISSLITEDPDVFNSDINRRLEMDLGVDDQHNEKEELELERDFEREQEQIERDKRDKVLKPQLDNLQQSFDNISKETDSIQNLDDEVNKLSMLLNRFGSSL